jgi:hypothetical protein
MILPTLITAGVLGALWLSRVPPRYTGDLARVGDQAVFSGAPALGAGLAPDAFGAVMRVTRADQDTLTGQVVGVVPARGAEMLPVGAIAATTTVTVPRSSVIEVRRGRQGYVVEDGRVRTYSVTPLAAPTIPAPTIPALPAIPAIPGLPQDTQVRVRALPAAAFAPVTPVMMDPSGLPVGTVEPPIAGIPSSVGQIGQFPYGGYGYGYGYNPYAGYGAPFDPSVCPYVPDIPGCPPETGVRPQATGVRPDMGVIDPEACAYVPDAPGCDRVVSCADPAGCQTYSTPSHLYPTGGSLAQGDRVLVLAREGDWLRVTKNSRQAWVPASAFESPGGAAA